MIESELARFMSRVELIPFSTCWWWMGAITPEGYPSATVRGKTRRGHTAIYEHYFGPVPSGLCLDHICRNRSCVNIAHLEVVTYSVNVLRGNHRGKRPDLWEKKDPQDTEEE